MGSVLVRGGMGSVLVHAKTGPRPLRGGASGLRGLAPILSAPILSNFIGPRRLQFYRPPAVWGVAATTFHRGSRRGCTNGGSAKHYTWAVLTVVVSGFRLVTSCVLENMIVFECGSHDRSCTRRQQVRVASRWLGDCSDDITSAPGCVRVRSVNHSIRVFASLLWRKLESASFEESWLQVYFVLTWSHH